jgi:NitT/TauT family transport system ATP-binding protein
VLPFRQQLGSIFYVKLEPVTRQASRRLRPRERRTVASAQPSKVIPLAMPDAIRAAQGPGTIELHHVSVTFGRGADALMALGDVTLEVRQGEFIGLVGPSGCGKSTILRLVCGLLAPTSGAVTVAGKRVERGKLSVGIAFQNPTLLPWLTIERNVMLPLKVVEPFRSQYHAKRRTEFRDRVHALLAQVGLKGFANKFPWQLSGGMQQRANLCRALIHGPKLLLLDEPFGALDHFTREALWGTMQELWMERCPTVLLVTHDLREAAYLATRICVMSARPGRIICDQNVTFARPRTIPLTYEHDFVALNQRLRTLISDVPTS